MKIDSATLHRCAQAMRLANYDLDRMMMPPSEWDELKPSIQGRYLAQVLAVLGAAGIEVEAP